MNTDPKYYPQIMSIFKDDYPNYHAYYSALREARQHYGYSAKVEGGYKFFEFETDYTTWKNQK